RPAGCAIVAAMRATLVCLVVGAAACGGGDATSPDAPRIPQPDAAPLTCNTIAQDCLSHGSVATPKCSLVTPANGSLATRCVGSFGTKGLGESCMRFSGGPGFDDCDKGFFCSGLTMPQNLDGTSAARSCRKFCRDDGACQTGERCVVLGSGTPQDGLCVPA